MDANRLRESFRQVAAHGGDAIAHYFYADLFLRHPELRRIFPMSMAAQREHLIAALVQIVAAADQPDNLTGLAAHLGRVHYDRDVIAEHYPVVGARLLATLKHFSGDTWTPEVAADWTEAYQLLAKLMCEAADDTARRTPPRWHGTVLACEQRDWDITVLYVAVNPDGPPLEYLPGQAVMLELEQLRLRRCYSPATPPPGNGVLEFHVRWAHGGQVAPALAGLTPGDGLLIRRPRGTMTFTPSGRDIIMAAWSTGWAPLKAILLQLRQMPAPPRVHLFTGARRPEGLYDTAALDKLAAPWLTVTPVVADGPDWPGETGQMAEVIARRGPWGNRDAYLAGAGEWIQETTARLTEGGMPQEQVRTEDFGWRGEH